MRIGRPLQSRSRHPFIRPIPPALILIKQGSFNNRFSGGLSNIYPTGGNGLRGGICCWAEERWQNPFSEDTKKYLARQMQSLSATISFACIQHPWPWDRVDPPPSPLHNPPHRYWLRLQLAHVMHSLGKRLPLSHCVESCRLGGPAGTLGSHMPSIYLLPWPEKWSPTQIIQTSATYLTCPLGKVLHY